MLIHWGKSAVESTPAEMELANEHQRQPLSALTQTHQRGSKLEQGGETRSADGHLTGTSNSRDALSWTGRIFS